MLDAAWILALHNTIMPFRKRGTPSMAKRKIAIGQVAAGAVIASFVLGLWVYFQTPSADVVATVRYAPIIWPPQLADEARDLWRSSDENKTLFSYRDSAFYSRFNLQGVWTAQVINQGDLVASSLSLRLPYALLFSVRKEGREAEISEGEETIQLGDLLPLETIAVTAWTKIEPTEASARNIRLSHESGLGTIRAYGQLSPIWVWLSRWWYPVLPAVVLLSMILGHIMDHVTGQIKTSTSEDSKTQDEDD